MRRNRRDFLRETGAGAGVALVETGAMLQGLDRRPPHFTAPPIKTVRAGVVGVGKRGSKLAQILAALDNVEIRAVCDIVPEKVDAIQKVLVNKGFPRPRAYTKGPEDHKRLCDTEDLDIVINAGPWELHTPGCVAAMKGGKHAYVEVPSSISVEECWELVETSEKMSKYCVLLENSCYIDRMMMILNMVRHGVFGELVHCQAGYQHDCRAIVFDKAGSLLWRGKHQASRNGNLYPTHPIGPISQWLNINRGDRFEYIVSMSSKAVGMNVYAREKFGAEHRSATRVYKGGDVNVSLIKTAQGRTITLYYNVQLPRPYDMVWHVQGTKGIYLGTLDQIYIEGRSPKAHTWEPIGAYAKEFRHPTWESLERRADKFYEQFHGGSDYVTLHRLVGALQKGIRPEIDVYDTATWSAIFGLSIASVNKRSSIVEFPDFTRGKWRTNPPLGVTELS